MRRAAQVRKGSSVTTAKSMLSYVRLRQALSGSSAPMHPKRTHKLAFVLKGVPLSTTQSASCAAWVLQGCFIS